MVNSPLPKKIPYDISEKYEVHEWRHALAVLQTDYPQEWQDVVKVLRSFRLLKSEIVASGGRKTKIAERLDKPLYELGWCEKKFETSVQVDQEKLESPTHKVDCYKNQVALEVEWNNKDPFFDRDLNNFRLLFDLRAISVGVVITRCDELESVFHQLNVHKSYGQSTTHMRHLISRIQGGGGGGCPILAFGIRPKLYEDDGSEIPERSEGISEGKNGEDK